MHYDIVGTVGFRCYVHCHVSRLKENKNSAYIHNIKPIFSLVKCPTHQLEPAISILCVVGWYISCLFKFQYVSNQWRP